jgi:hypothetical protein
LSWQTDPIDCRRLAELAGPVPGGSIRYMRTCEVEGRLDELATGQPAVLVTSGSDATATPAMAAFLPKNIKRWFTTNCAVPAASTTGVPTEAIPIGFTACSGDVLAMLAAQAALPRTRRNLLYVNHRRVHPSYRFMERARLYEAFRPFRWATLRDEIPQADFYAELAAHDYILSPAGAGPDCHRTWEALALGTIPIVRRSVYTAVLGDLPALQVDGWGEVTADRLEAALPILRARFGSPVMQKLTLGYWRRRMEAALCV